MTSSERVLFHQFQESLLLGFVESPHADLTEDMISPRFRSFRTLQISNCQIGKQRTNYRALLHLKAIGSNPGSQTVDNRHSH